jgi:hypothetical protein
MAQPEVEWETPDDARTAIIYGLPTFPSDAERAAALHALAARIASKLRGAVRRIQVCAEPFAAFAARHPYLVTSGAADAAGPPPPLLPASIADGVWLGSELHTHATHAPASAAPLAVRALSLLDVRAVVCVMDDPGGVGGERLASSDDGAAADGARAGFVSVVRFPWVDADTFAIAPHLDAVADAVEAGRRAGGGGVLVHCYHGASRSAAAVAAGHGRRRGALATSCG